MQMQSGAHVCQRKAEGLEHSTTMLPISFCRRVALTCCRNSTSPHCFQKGSEWSFRSAPKYIVVHQSISPRPTSCLHYSIQMQVPTSIATRSTSCRGIWVWTSEVSTSNSCCLLSFLHLPFTFSWVSCEVATCIPRFIRSLYHCELCWATYTCGYAVDNCTGE